MLPPFDIAAASVIGREHARAGRNNQDALSLLAQGEVLAAVVADGCGSGAHSEVGAQIAQRIRQPGYQQDNEKCKTQNKIADTEPPSNPVVMPRFRRIGMHRAVSVCHGSS